VLELYTDARLRLVLCTSAASALFAYSVWALELPSVDGIPWRPLSIAAFTACIFRHGVRLRAGEGDAPEKLLLSDTSLAVAGLAWIVLFALGVDAAS
jgi:hypothetical protein